MHPAPRTQHSSTPHRAPSTKHLALWAATLILAVGALVRVAYLDVPPIDFHATRQYRSALIARAESDAALAALTPVERGNAVAMAQAQGEIEPELMEPIASWLYDVTGQEDLKLPRAVAIMGWLLAAVATFWLVTLSALRTDSAPRTSFALRTPHSALIALCVVLFVPYSVDASRAFMPDPWMVGLTMFALALAMRHHVSPQVWTMVGRVVVAAAAIYVKPMAVFFVAPAFLAIDIARLGWLRGMLSAAVTLALCAAPAAWHYVTLMSSGNPVAQSRFYPELWSRPTFWTGWLTMLNRVNGLLWVAALVGIIIGRGPLRLMLAAAWVGYIAMGFVFSHHISTHDYYSLPLIPLVAASIALLVRPSSSERPGASSERRGFSPAVPWPYVAAGVAILILAPVSMERVYGNVDRARQTAADYERIGELTSHSPGVISLDGSYGYPLAYHARITTSQLPLSIDRAVAAIKGDTGSPLLSDIRARSGQYFVGTIQTELDAEPFAKAWLDQRTALVDRGGDDMSWRYVVYDLTTPTRFQQAAVPGSLPVGSVDAPPPGEIVLGDTFVNVQGWALDDVELAGVQVAARAADGTERVIGQATRGGKRPDVEAAFPSFPGHDRAVWTFMLFPDDKNLGPVTLVFRAVDAQGNSALLGERALR